ncbi:alpha/beta-hydrolase [Imleria badia]|nr:alpha/beta-hydrolase [Imleria badia]
MRLIVTVDEPSSALDPEAEYRLFAILRKERKGRTMIFVTHRFGHLTKHADLILCIKEGTVVETGTHADLLSRGAMKLVDLLRRLVSSLTNQYLHHSPRSDRSPQLSIWYCLISAYSAADAPSAYEPESLRPHEEQRSPRSPPPPPPPSQDTIHRLMNNPTLFDPARAPRYPIVLCHGLYGFDVRGPAAFPSLRLHYWSSVLSILKHKLGAEVIVTGVPATGSIASRAESLDRILQQRARGRGINLMAHSMGGLDGRHLISHIRPTEYVPLSLTSISTPHRGSPFMDWCAKGHRRNQYDQQYLGLGRRQHDPTHQGDPERQTQPELEPTSNSNNASEKREAAFRLSLSTFTTLLLSLIDSPAYANLTTSYLNDVFNPSTPDDPRVKYFSVASRIDEMNIWHPLWFPKMVLDDAEQKARKHLKTAAGSTSYSATIPPWEQENEWGNDGLVTVQSARWGEFLGILDGCDHWEIRDTRRAETNMELSSGIGNITNRVAGEGWALGDWSKFIGAWRKHERGGSESLEFAQATGIVPSESDARGTNRITQDSRNDPIVKASTDKLSTVFDWIVEHVPTPGNPSPPKEDETGKSDLAAKFDLERFYVALTRKLYDEGL